MAFVQRESATLAAAIKRMNGLTAIDPTAKLDLGNGHTTKSYQDQMKDVETQLGTYNKARKDLDALKNKLDAAEKLLAKKSSAMLTGVGQKYTKDSDEYEQCGGVRESERQKTGPKAKPTPKA